MWSYNYVIPSILILWILLFYYFTLKRLPIRINHRFVGLMVVEAVVIVTDIVASYADQNYRQLPHSLVVALNMLYFAALLIRIKMFYSITSNIFRLDPYTHKLRAFIKDIPIIISEIIVLSSPWTGAVFAITEVGYVNGPYYNIIYLCYFYFLALSFYDLIVHQDRLRRKRDAICVFLYNFTILVGLLFRIYFPKVLIFDTFCVMAVLLINLVFMNPDFYLDKRSNLFTSEALRSMLSEKNTIKEHYIMAFIVKNYGEAREVYGPSQMDEAIMIIGRYLLRNYTDVLSFYYRNGRFVLLGKDNERLLEIKEQLLDRFKEPWVSNNAEVYLEIGVVTSDFDLVNVETDSILPTIIHELVKFDNDRHKNCTVIDENTILETEKLIEVKRCLEYALEHKETEVFLQPIVDVHTRELVGAEALCRIRDRDGNVISPGLFIPIAEHNGHITLLGEQMFEKTCKFIKENDIAAMGLQWINVNVSTIQFMQHSLATRFEEILEQYGLTPDKIHLELTEAAMVDEQLMAGQILDLQKKGFNLVVDDYGTGYSNIARLKRYPFVNIKLDMTLVWEYCKNPGVIVPKMVEAFKETGYSVTAEGIESEELAQAMERCGCDLLQGMYFNPPLPIKDFLKEYSKSP